MFILSLPFCGAWFPRFMIAGLSNDWWCWSGLYHLKFSTNDLCRTCLASDLFLVLLKLLSFIALIWLSISSMSRAIFWKEVRHLCRFGPIAIWFSRLWSLCETIVVAVFLQGLYDLLLSRILFKSFSLDKDLDLLWFTNRVVIFVKSYD